MFMKFKTVPLVFAVLLFASPVFPVTLKVGSVAPRNSPWDKALTEISSRWAEASGGRVVLKIYPGGIAGGEADMLRKVKVGALDGAVLSSMGLNKISPDLLILTMPLIIKDKPELDYVMKKIGPTYEEIMKEKRYKLIGWTMAGWMKVFSRDPVRYPDDLRAQKLGFTSGEDVLIQILKNMGFHIVPSDTIDWLSSLQSGRVDALLISPLIAAAYQVFTLADNMLDYPISPLLGAIVFSDRSWRKVPEKYHDEFLEIVSEVVADLDVESKALEDKAFDLLLENGLQVQETTPEIEREWNALIDEIYGKEGVIGKVISRDVFEEVTGYTKEYREMNGSNTN